MEKATRVTIIVSILIIAGFIALVTFSKKPEEQVTLPLEIEVHSSFHCPYCKEFFPVMMNLKERLKNEEVNITYYHTDETGEYYDYLLATLAAGEQDKEYEYMGILYENQGNFSPADLPDFAEQLELDLDKFNEDRNNPDIIAKAQAQFDYVDQRNITYTPTLIINDRIIRERDEEKLYELIMEKVNLGKQQRESDGQDS